MAAPWPQIVLFGDSLFQGAAVQEGGFCFQTALQTLTSRRYDVINRGLSGYNTSQALRVLPEIFPAISPGGPQMKYLFVLLGANDAAVTMPIDSQHVPLEEYEANLKAIVTHPNIVAHKEAKILVVTPPPLDEIRITELDMKAGHPHPMRYAQISASYSEAARRVARSTPGVVLVDLYAALMDEAVKETRGFDAASGTLGDPKTSGQRGYLEKLLPDGLHMSGKAYEIFYKAIEPHIEPQHPNLTVDGFVLPEWRSAPLLEKK